MLQDLESHKRHRDSLGHHCFQGIKGFLGALHRFGRHVVVVARQDPYMLVKVVLEVVATVGPSLFGNLVIPVLMYFVVVEGHAIQGFKEPTCFAAELV